MDEEFEAQDAEALAMSTNWLEGLERLYGLIKTGIKQKAEKGEYELHVDLERYGNGEIETLKRWLLKEGFSAEKPSLAEVIFIQW